MTELLIFQNTMYVFLQPHHQHAPSRTTAYKWMPLLKVLMGDEEAAMSPTTPGKGDNRRVKVQAAAGEPKTK